MVDQGCFEISRLSIRLGLGKHAFTAVENVSLSNQPGEFICILGPSGCGKSTLLSSMAGHVASSQGAIKLDGQLITKPNADIGLVFQQHSLFPWQRVIDNVAFGLKMRGINKSERHRQAREMLELVGLSGFEQHYPVQLSGGMQQRVEIARVLINTPKVILMDEPFGALDAQTRLSMQQFLLSVWEGIKTSVIFITHDIEEALFLADRLLIMSQRPGRFIEEIPLDFARPRTTELLATPRFVQLKQHCLTVLQSQNHL